jgi:hypothetical protein
MPPPMACKTVCKRVVVQFDSLSLGEGRGEGLARQVRNNSPGFSPLSRQATGQFFDGIDACEEFLDGLRAEARRKVCVVGICAPALTPPLSHVRTGDIGNRCPQTWVTHSTMA